MSGLAFLETGERPPNDILLNAWLDRCEVTGLARTALAGEWRLARSKEGPVKVWVAPWFETEAKAHTLRYWAPVIVPGLVQTPDYARELFAAMALDEAKASEFLEVRMGRQEIMDRPEPPDITIVLWEPVLHHQIGTPHVMREQLARLVNLACRPAVTIHILPSRHGANPGRRWRDGATDPRLAEGQLQRQRRGELHATAGPPWPGRRYHPRGRHQLTLRP